MLQFFYKVYADKIGHQKPLRRHFSNKQKMRCAAIANNIKQKIKKRLYWHVHFKYVANQISLNVTPAVDRPSAEIIFQWWRPNVTAHGVQVQALSGNHWYWFDTVPKCVLWWENDLKKRGHFTAVADPSRQQVPDTIWQHLTLHHLFRCCKPPFYEHGNGPSLGVSGTIVSPLPILSYTRQSQMQLMKTKPN